MLFAYLQAKTISNAIRITSFYQTCDTLSFIFSSVCHLGTDSLPWDQREREREQSISKLITKVLKIPFYN